MMILVDTVTSQHKYDPPLFEVLYILERKNKTFGEGGCGDTHNPHHDLIPFPFPFSPFGAPKL